MLTIDYRERTVRRWASPMATTAGALTAEDGLDVMIPPDDA